MVHQPIKRDLNHPHGVSRALNPDVETAVFADHLADRRSLAETPLKRFFETAVWHGASDLLLRGGQVPKVRLRGELKSLDTPAVDHQQFEKWVESAMSQVQWSFFAEHGSIDLGVNFELSDGTTHRFRVNVFRTRGRSAIAARHVSNTILTCDRLHLPAILHDIAQVEHGLILVAGTTGSGKSTTVASMLEHVNQSRGCHILTLEDPIEYLFHEAKSLINQREIGIDVPSFAVGLRALVREDPDVVFIGEMRDKETFEAALQAAETGHLVFCSVHASHATQVFGRIYDLFTVEERPGIRNLLAYHLHAVICQKLLPSIREEVQRIPAVEILLQSPPVRKYILESREYELGEVIMSERDMGMQSFTDSLIELVNHQFIHPKVALAAATRPEQLKMKLKGIEAY